MHAARKDREEEKIDFHLPGSGEAVWDCACGIQAPDPIFVGVCQLLGTKYRTLHAAEAQEAQGGLGGFPGTWSHLRHGSAPQ